MNVIYLWARRCPSCEARLQPIDFGPAFERVISCRVCALLLVVSRDWGVRAALPHSTRQA